MPGNEMKSPVGEDEPTGIVCIVVRGELEPGKGLNNGNLGELSNNNGEVVIIKALNNNCKERNGKVTREDNIKEDGEQKR